MEHCTGGPLKRHRKQPFAQTENEAPYTATARISSLRISGERARSTFLRVSHRDVAEPYGRMRYACRITYSTPCNLFRRSSNTRRFHSDSRLNSGNRKSSVAQTARGVKTRRGEKASLSARSALDRASTSIWKPENGAEKEKPRKPRLAGFPPPFYWRRRRDSNPRSRFWPRCSLSRGVPSTSRPRLPKTSLAPGRQRNEAKIIAG